MTNSNGSNGHKNGSFLSNDIYTNGFTKKEKDHSHSDTSQYEFDIRLIWGMLARHKYAILFITLLTTFLFGFVAYNMESTYKSEGSILISESKAYNPARGNGISALLSTMYGIGGENKVDDELQILKSRSLSLEIAEKLMQNPIMDNGQKYPVLWQKYPKDPTTTSRDTVAQRIRENITFSQAKKSKLINISYESKSPLEAAEMVNLTMNTYTDFSSDQNRATARSAVQFLQEEKKRIQEDLKEAEQKLRNFMNKEDLVELDSQTNRLIGNIADLESNIQSIKVKLVAANSAIEQYRERLKNIKPQLIHNYTDAILPKLDRFQYQLAELETEKMLMISRNPAIDDQTNPPAELQRLNEKITRLKQDIRNMTEELISENGDWTGSIGSTGENLAGNISEINKKLIELKVEQNQYEAQKEVLSERLREERSFFEELPNNMIQLARMKREVEINEQLYRTVSQQLAEMKLWEQTRFGLGRQVDKGYVPKEAEGTNPLLFIVAGLLVGGILGLCYTCIREFTDSTINRVEQVQQYNLPILGLIPKLNRIIKEKHGKKSKANLRGAKISTKLVTLFNDYSTESEAFRRLSNKVIYSPLGEKLQTIMITSYGKGEGEATVSSNLAIALAEMGKKVLVIDTDFRRPDLHAMLGLQNSPGIMEVLSDRALLDDVIQQTVVPRLDLLSPGEKPSNPVLINQSKALNGMITFLKNKYDHLLLKSAPLGILSDSIPLIPLADGVIAVGRFNKTREDEFGQLIHNLQDVNANITGVVLSSFEYTKSLDYYSGYSRSYRRAYEDYFSHKSHKSKKEKQAIEV